MPEKVRIFILATVSLLISGILSAELEENKKQDITSSPIEINVRTRSDAHILILVRNDKSSRTCNAETCLLHRETRYRNDRILRGGLPTRAV